MATNSLAIFEIPTSPRPQSFSVTFPNGVTYQLRLLYVFAPNDCWTLDIADDQGNPILSGIPLVTGADLLAQGEPHRLGRRLARARPRPPRLFALAIHRIGE